VHFVANVGPSQPLPENGAIELTFDRLLMPASITRQTFILSTITGSGLTPTVAYDPVSRVVTLQPEPGTMTAGQTYQLTVLPRQPGLTYMQPVATVIGVTAIDGATLEVASDGGTVDSPAPVQIPFQVTAAATQVGVLTVDYCSQINKIFAGCAGASGCHGSPPDIMPAQGLVLTDPAGVLATAIGQVAVEANTGPRPAAQSPNLIFGLDMPIIDPSDPGGSWLMYKVLMAVPPPDEAPVPGPGGDAIVPLSSTERATLASLVPGREMPFPTVPSNPIQSQDGQLTIAELETLSVWIGQGAPVQSCP
jgi:hypothetical protein